MCSGKTGFTGPCRPPANARTSVPITEANARWLITQDASAARYALAQAQAAGSIPWHYYDTAKGHYLSVTDYPQLWIDYRGSVQPKQMAGDESGWYPDRAHTPDLSYVAWLLTGDRYHLDMLNAQASWVIANTWNGYRQDAQGIVTNAGRRGARAGLGAAHRAGSRLRQPRWVLREGLFHANREQQLGQSARRDGDAHRHPRRGPRLCPGHSIVPGIIAPWQQDFFASTAALGALQGNQDARAVLKWQANFLSGRFLSPDLNPYNGFIYWLNVGDSSGKALTTWAEVAAATKAAGDY